MAKLTVIEIAGVKKLRQLTPGGALVLASTNDSPCCCDDTCRTIGTTLSFSEYPLDTTITDQYKNNGVIFDSDCFITDDPANPTAPVLSGRPRFQGSITAHFVDPAGGSTAIGVAGFAFDAGFFDEPGTTRLTWFGKNGNELGRVLNPVAGIYRFNVQAAPDCIYGFSLGPADVDPAGFAIDNLSF